MPNDSLDVFLSSDQTEFAQERRALATIISNLPYFSCIPLENQGAAPRDVVEQSLRKVRDSDIYVGIFGEEYSSTTIKEYDEAVKKRKPCFIYVKKAVRDPRLEKFIGEEVKNRFKFFEFTQNNELYNQVENDLKVFVLDTLRDGLEARAAQKDKIEKLIIAEKRTPTITKSTEFLEQAETDLKQGLVLESLVKTSMAMELTLSQELTKKGIVVARKPFTELLYLAREQEILTYQEVKALQRTQYLRNAALHKGDVPDKQTMTFELKNVKRVLSKLS
jgi:hypothetical protein